jgi:hypothetical protein
LVGVASRQHAPFGQNSAESELLSPDPAQPNCLLHWTWQFAWEKIHAARCQVSTSRDLSNNAGLLTRFGSCLGIQVLHESDPAAGYMKYLLTDLSRLANLILFAIRVKYNLLVFLY